MDRDAVVRALQESERIVAIGWCGAKAGEQPVAALRGLVGELRESEGSEYELKASGLDRMSQILLLTLCGRYGLRAVRRKRQRHNTVVLQGPETFLEKVLWPMFGKQMDAIVPGVDTWLHDVITAGLAGEDDAGAL